MEASSELPGIRVLVVDDEPDALEVLGFALSLRGALVTCAGSVNRALEVSAAQYEIVLTDLSMPQRDGYDLLCALRERGDRTPVIALTGVSMPHERQRGLASGFAEYLIKPIDHEILVAAIRRALQRDSS